MWAASTPPPRRYRTAAVVAVLLAPLFSAALAPGPLGLLAGPHRAPAPLVEHSHIADAAGTAQHLIPAPAADPGSGPAARTGPPGALPAPRPPARTVPPAPAAPDPGEAPPSAVAAPAAPPVPPGLAALAAVVDAHLADPRLAGTTVGLSVWADGLGEIGRNADAPRTRSS